MSLLISGKKFDLSVKIKKNNLLKRCLGKNTLKIIKILEILQLFGFKAFIAHKKS